MVDYVILSLIVILLFSYLLLIWECKDKVLILIYQIY